MVLSQEEMVLYTRGNGALYKRKWCYIQEKMVLYTRGNGAICPLQALFSNRFDSFKSI